MNTVWFDSDSHTRFTAEHLTNLFKHDETFIFTKAATVLAFYSERSFIYELNDRVV